MSPKRIIPSDRSVVINLKLILTLPTNGIAGLRGPPQTIVVPLQIRIPLQGDASTIPRGGLLTTTLAPDLPNWWLN